MNESGSVFDFQAAVGLTKHLGGNDATFELLELCRIDEGKVVLDVGCGAGATACLVAKTYGCQVVGVDLLPAMVERSHERAAKEGVEDRTEFRVADARDLPFEEDRFDIVMTESVTVFPPDKVAAVAEYARVTKPGGYIGLNETTWLKTPVPEAMVAYVAQDLAMNAQPLDGEGWADILARAGLQDIVTQTHTFDARGEVRGLFQRYGCRNILGVWGKMLVMYIRDPTYRAFLKETRKQETPALRDIYEYMGYGIYVGRKGAK